jgi:lysophospholipase L1-like esterase
LEARLQLARLRSYRLLRYALLRGLGAGGGTGEGYRPGAMELFSFRAYQEVNLFALRRLVAAIQARGLPLLLLDYPQAPVPENPLSPDEYYVVRFAGHLRSTPLREDEYLVPRAWPHETAINGILRAVAAEAGVPLVSNARLFAAEPDPGALFLPGDEHPDGEGYARMAGAVVERLEALGWLGEEAP